MWILHSQVRVTKSLTTKISKTIFAWEKPVLRMKYPDLQEVRDFWDWHEPESLERITPASEYLRMEELYGFDEKKNSFAQLAYQGELMANQTLGSVMRESVSSNAQDDKPEEKSADYNPDQNIFDMANQTDAPPAAPTDPENPEGDQGGDPNPEASPTNPGDPMLLPQTVDTLANVNTALQALGGDPDPELDLEEAKDWLNEMVVAELQEGGLADAVSDDANANYQVLVAQRLTEADAAK